MINVVLFMINILISRLHHPLQYSIQHVMILPIPYTQLLSTYIIQVDTLVTNVYNEHTIET